MQRTSAAVNVLDCIEWATRSTSHEVRQCARLIKQLGAVPAISGDETRLSQVFVNLLLNAAQAIGPGAADRNEVTIRTRTDAQGWAVVEVSDSGTGIREDVLGRIFEPFFTTKGIGVGTGLGLSICHGIVTSLSGELRAENLPERGTRFEVRLPPAVSNSGNPAAVAGTGPQTRELRGRVLVIDDEEMVLRLLARVLRDHDVVCTQRAPDALAMLEAGQRFDLIVSDLMMPTMTGMEFYEVLLGLDLGLARRIIFLTGGALTSKASAFLTSVTNVHIQAAALRAAVQRLLAAAS